MSFDLQVLEFLVAHRTAWATAISNATMAVGTSLTLQALVAVVALLVAVYLKAQRVALAVGVAVVSAGIATGLLKQVFERPRPPVDLVLVQAQGWSFPSTQAAETSAIAAALLVAVPWSSRVVRRALAAVLVAGVVGVGACMVYLGAHWVTDVLAGWLLGSAIGIVAGLLLRRRRRPAATSTTRGRGRPVTSPRGR